MYCYYGYDFLDCVAHPYGLHADQIFMYFEAESFDDLPENTKQEFILNCYPNIIDEINRVLNWLKNEEIILTGKTDRNGKLKYIDNRIDLENSNLKAEKDMIKKIKWWQFWKQTTY
ncbi:hypothetical protein P8625_01915 [Tenacibaculum tangerinum]|uniref:Uncharacterized protein n=1 Tax=Tenacibaculum tangerinum TaxID=3038772 RepID=A0ABY8L4D2_9FLAO|nr:hypothetical protein [Tenacibaculum tangerinum]WGH75946.1 hypothetical protein P8625_01915 [Tenacibaculum tangerinum]